MRIAEVSKQFDISADTLRYYERIGLLSHVHRNESGIRDYGEQDLARIRFVKCMRGANVSIEALLEYMELFEGGDATLRARKAILEKEREKVRERMAEMQAGLDRLDYKIAHYEDLIVKAEQKIAGGARIGAGLSTCSFSLLVPTCHAQTRPRGSGGAFVPHGRRPQAQTAPSADSPRGYAPSELPCKPAVRLRKEKCKRLR